KKFGFHDGPVVEIDVDKVDLTNRIHVGYIFEKIYEALVKKEKKEEMKKQEKKEVPNDAARSVVVESEVTDVSEEPL
ncbi:hypothetical protein KY349_04065, partial [Candidatus Woesearchaeota archaeon]|nr:hypothetical protein [Candidatus Woesearchaeota archaeon]